MSDTCRPYTTYVKSLLHYNTVNNKNYTNYTNYKNYRRDYPSSLFRLFCFFSPLSLSFQFLYLIRHSHTLSLILSHSLSFFLIPCFSLSLPFPHSLFLSLILFLCLLYIADEDKFLERMEYVRPRFDTALIAYLQVTRHSYTLIHTHKYTHTHTHITLCERF